MFVGNIRNEYPHGVGEYITAALAAVGRLSVIVIHLGWAFVWLSYFPATNTAWRIL